MSGANASHVQDWDGAFVPVKRALANIATATTDGAIVAAVAAKRIRVLSLSYSPGNAAATLTLTTKPAGAGTAISPVLSSPANGCQSLPYNPQGHFLTGVAEGLSGTTSSSGVSMGVHVTYIESSEP